MKKVLVFGDSFTDFNAGKLSKRENWLHMLQNDNDWEVENFSITGSGPNLALTKFLDYTSDPANDFDLCIFAWSEPSRIWNGAVNDINVWSAERKSTGHQDSEIYKTAQDFFGNYFYNRNLFNIMHKGTLMWLDQYTKKRFPDKQFWHFNCFPALNDGEYRLPEHFENDDNVLVEDRLYHVFDNGITIYPSLVWLSDRDSERPDNIQNDWRPGHLGKQLHQAVADKLSTLLTDSSITSLSLNGAEQPEILD